MAHIVEFSIAGLAGNNKVYRQKLNRNLNIFFGLNGSGKTSLLKILHSAMSRDANILQYVPFKWAEVVIHSLDYEKDFVTKISKEDLLEKMPIRKMRKLPTRINRYDIDEDFVYASARARRTKQFSWQYKTQLPTGRKGKWFHRYLPTWRLGMSDILPHRWRSELEMGTFSEEELDKLFAQSLIQLWSRYSTELLSDIKGIQEKGLANILQGILTTRKIKAGGFKKVDSRTAYQRVITFLKRQKSRSVLTSYKKFEKRYNSDPELRKVVSDINKIETEIETAAASRKKLEDLIKSMFSGNKKIIFKDTEINVEIPGGDNIPLNLLSSGEKHLLRIFIETLLTSVSTLLIDEPEISLHIDWQERLISEMQQLNPDAQFIIATHSPAIMAKVSDENIFKL